MSKHPSKKVEYGSYLWLMSEVGSYLDFSYDSRSWDFDTRAEVDSIVQSGYRLFCHPVAMQGQVVQGDGDEVQKEVVRKAPYHWSFLAPISQLNTVSGKDTYKLEEDFGSMLGEFTSGTTRIPIVAETQLRSIAIREPKIGTPSYAAIRPTRSRGWEVLLYPNPDAVLNLKYKYVKSPRDLSEENPLPVSGNEHAETLLAACLSVAEERKNKTQGVMSARYQERLAASISIDKQSATITETNIWEDSKKNDLLSLLGHYMGYGPNENSWTLAQEQNIKVALRQGKRNFYLPPILPGEKNVHNWSFLYPVKKIILKSGVGNYDLPENFAGIDGDLSYDTVDSAVPYPTVRLVSELIIRNGQQMQNASSRPYHAAYRVKDGVENSPSRYELMVFPIPDDTYTLQYRMRVTMDNDTIHHGGGEHFQTLLASAKVEADRVLKRSPKQAQSEYIERLRSSVSIDRDLLQDSLGYNGDKSGRSINRFGDFHDYDENIVTYNGDSSW